MSISCSTCLSNFECTCFAMAVSALHANIVVACLSMHVSCLNVSTAWQCCTACFLLKYALFMCVITHVCRWSKLFGYTDAHATCTGTTTQQHMHTCMMCICTCPSTKTPLTPLQQYISFVDVSFVDSIQPMVCIPCLHMHLQSLCSTSVGVNTQMQCKCMCMHTHAHTQCTPDRHMYVFVDCI